MLSLVRKISAEEDGQGLVEYAFILLLVAMVAMAGLKSLPDGIMNALRNTSEGFN